MPHSPLFPYPIFAEVRNVGSVTLHSIKKKAQFAASGSGRTSAWQSGKSLQTAKPSGGAPVATEISIPTTLTLTRKEFATAFRLSLRTVERMIAADKIQIRHIGPRAVRIPRTEAERYLGTTVTNASTPHPMPSPPAPLPADGRGWRRALPSAEREAGRPSGPSLPEKL